jgi:tRNA nucleotidyltransferase/poly(A) polymerase
MMELPDSSTPQRRAIEIVKEVAREKHCRPFLVGGPVRDILLGRSSFDVDLAVEDDSSVLARALAKRTNGRVKSFPQFLTYKVVADDMPEIDIATARKEKYRQPGSLPVVTRGKLRDDLLRRDFSINAIALDLTNGTLHDPTGGARDIGERLVRVLHERSFLDDPTRVFRAIRLATRLGFALEGKTAQQLRDAIRAGALQTVSKERIWREVFLAMDEQNAPAVLVEMAAWGAFDVLFGPRQVDESLHERLTLAKREIDRNPELDRYVIFTGALLHGNASPVDLEGSGFSQKRARNIVQIANELPHFTDALAEAASDPQRFQILRAASPEMLTVLASLVPAERESVARYREFQSFQLPLRGNELDVEPGPHVARALERTREAVFTGEISPDQAREFARTVALQYRGEN